MKRTVLATLSLLGIFALLIAVTAWEPWKSREREHEVAWIEAYSEWSDGIDAGLAGGDFSPAASCAESYATDVGDAPARLLGAAGIALNGCRQLERAIDASELESGSDAWYAIRESVLANLTNQRAQVAAPERSAELGVYAAPLAHAHPPVLCWSERHWSELSEEWRLIRIDELWPIGMADKDAGRIHLAPQICGPLHRFFGGTYAPNLNVESLDLAEALVTLAHEAEHLRSPAASEAQVECVAIQRVRDLVRAAGRGRAYENLMAGLAWDVGYPNMPDEYRTEDCHNGSALDVRPTTSVFP